MLWRDFLGTLPNHCFLRASVAVDFHKAEHVGVAASSSYLTMACLSVM